MKRLLLASSALAVAFAAPFALSQPPEPGIRAEPAPASGGKVPVLGDVPVLGSLFSQAEEVLWFPLATTESEASSAKDDFSAGSVGRAEQAILRAIRARFPEVQVADVVERLTIRNDGEQRRVNRDRGIEVRAPKRHAAEIRALVARHQALDRRMIAWEVLVVDVGEAAGGEAGKAVAVNRAAWTARQRELAEKKAGETVAAPKILTLNGQKAHVSIANQLSYIKDFKVEIVQGAAIVDPVIDVLSEGLFLELYGLVDPETQDLLVEGKLVLSAIERPIRDVETEVHGKKLSFQLPTVSTSTWRADDLRLGPGEEGFMIPGLAWGPIGDGKKMTGPKNVEVWCFAKIQGEAGTSGSDVPALGTVHSVEQESGTVVVKWPPGYVDEAPWERSPKSVTFLRSGRSAGEGTLKGGWAIGDSTDPGRQSFAVYKMTAGTVEPGDAVR